MLKKVLVLTVALVLMFATAAFAADSVSIDVTTSGNWAGGDQNCLEVDGSSFLPVDNDVTYNGNPSVRVNMTVDGATWWCGFLNSPITSLAGYENGYLEFAIKGEKGGEQLTVGLKSGVYDADPAVSTEVNATKEITATTDWVVQKISIADLISTYGSLDPAFTPDNFDIFQVRSLNSSPLKVWISDIKFVSGDAAADSAAEENPTTGDFGMIPFLAMAAVSGAALLKRRNK